MNVRALAPSPSRELYPRGMRRSPAFALVFFTLACVQTPPHEKLSSDDREAMRRNACREAAWARCEGARDHVDCVEREALPCNTQVEKTLDGGELAPRPESVEDASPAAPVEPAP